ncbi:fibrillin-1-like, partial [Sycon ciliatum]|uniref:fibrillin-1-like n=1 Tax=Sycon ciliatum TaxID=27933 RepID=UPI0031F6CDF5
MNRKYDPGFFRYPGTNYPRFNDLAKFTNYFFGKDLFRVSAPLKEPLPRGGAIYDFGQYLTPGFQRIPLLLGNDMTSYHIRWLSFDPAQVNGSVIRCATQDTIVNEQVVMEKLNVFEAQIGEPLVVPMICHRNFWQKDTHWFSHQSKTVVPQNNGRIRFDVANYIDQLLHVDNFQVADNNSVYFCCHKDSCSSAPADVGKFDSSNFLFQVTLRTRAPPVTPSILGVASYPSATSVVLSGTSQVDGDRGRYFLLSCTGYTFSGPDSKPVPFSAKIRANVTDGLKVPNDWNLTVTGLTPSSAYVCTAKAGHYKALSESGNAFRFTTAPQYKAYMRPNEVRTDFCPFGFIVYDVKTNLPWDHVQRYSVQLRPDHSNGVAKNQIVMTFGPRNNGTHVRCGTANVTKFEIIYVARDFCTPFNSSAGSTLGEREIKLKLGGTYTAACRSGYQILGAHTVTCRNFTLSNEAPLCVPVTCDVYSQPSQIANGFQLTQLPPSGRYAVGTSVLYACEYHYEFVSSVGSVSCTMNSSSGAVWSQLPSCRAIDPCQSATCPGNATCTPQGFPNYKCTCPAGYYHNAFHGACMDIDECQKATDLCPVRPHFGCKNTIGSYSCDCVQAARREYRPRTSPSSKEVFDCKVDCNYTIANLGTFVLTLGSHRTLQCPLGHKPVAPFTISCGPKAELSTSQPQSCTPMTCPDIGTGLTNYNFSPTKISANYSLAGPHLVGASASIFCDPSSNERLELQLMPRLQSFAATLVCTLRTDRILEENVWVSSPGSPFSDVSGVRCSDSCEFSRAIPNGYLARTRGGQPADVRCNTGYALRKHGDITCGGASSPFYTYTPLANGNLPFSCVSTNLCKLNASYCPTKSDCVYQGDGAGATCTCADGFAFDTEKWQCVDVDECLQVKLDPSSKNCSAFAVCQNSPGAFTCSCPSHYSGDGSKCTPVDYCQSGVCPSHAHCSNDYTSTAGYVCTCPPGHSGPRCTDINECSNADGTPSNVCARAVSVCMNQPGNFYCACKHGYILDGTGTNCVEEDECGRGHHDCAPLTGACVNIVGSGHNCSCAAGYRGDGITCTNENECTLGLHSCGSKAQSTCFDTPGSYACVCANGYQESAHGQTCLDMDECSTGAHTCNTQTGICHNLPGSFTCTCRQGNAIDSCDDAHHCGTGAQSCHRNADCIAAGTAAGRSYSCKCKSGYEGSGRVCGNVDECLVGTHACSPHSNCSDTDGSYVCFCRAGFKRDSATGKCINVDECSVAAPCGFGAACTDTEGSFRCECAAGFQLRSGSVRICDDYDECAAGNHNCGQGTTCANTGGGFACPCSRLSGSRPLFNQTHHVCVDVNECSDGTHVCSVHATCDNTAMPYSCTCRTGYEGTGFECSDYDECSAGVHTCTAPRAHCSNVQGSYACTCAPGRELDASGSCANVDECARGTHSCHQGQKCTDTSDSFTCSCNPGYVGDDCKDADECVFSPCAQNADCVNLPGTYQCKCSFGYTGDGTQNCVAVDLCSLHGCSPHAACVRPGVAATGGSPTSDRVQCNCLLGFTGNGTHCADINE